MAPDEVSRERRRISRTSLVSVSRGPALVSINHGSTFMVCSADGSVDDTGREGQGLYADDTRFVSGYGIRLNSRPLRAVATSRLSFRHARWTFQTDAVASLDEDIPNIDVTVTLDRHVSDRRLHEDIVVTAYTERAEVPLPALLLTIDLQSDFADIFEVRTARWQRRDSIATTWSPAHRRLDTEYHRGSFERRCSVRSRNPQQVVSYANGGLHFPIDLSPRAPWHLCLQYDLISHPRARPQLAPCPQEQLVEDRAETLRRRWHRTVARANPGDMRLLRAHQQAVEDFAALRLYDHDFSEDVWLPAAGIPWFVAVFGRDSIIASMQALPLHPLFAIGTLDKLAAWQSDVDDPVRDAEPGKICHEMRVGEWAQFKVVPHSPYYGTADATPLYLVLLGETYRWLGDAERLANLRGTAERCLEWIDRYGDSDQDGFQEYAPRRPGGYRNQCWRDASDGVLDETGQNPPHPIGTCEMQAYVYAAKRSVAQLFADWGDTARAAALLEEAEAMRRRFVDAFWLDDEKTVAFALDGHKRALRTVTSNPGHCLWTGILDQERGRDVAKRLMQSDLFTGWGLRVLSSEHPAYDPHSYQRGSVWPHDTMIAAEGLRRYGLVEPSWRLIDGLLSAVTSFETIQMPELFAGLARSDPDVPIPYGRANVPQAWAAGTLFAAVRILLGLQPDVPAGRVYLDPQLPPWCPTLDLENVRIGNTRCRIRARRLPGGGCDVDVEAPGAPFEVVRGRPEWMLPPPA